MNDKLEHAIALLQFGRFAPLHPGPLLFYACVLVLLVSVLWLFIDSKKGRAAARRLSEESAHPAEGSPSSDEQRALLIKLEQEFGALKGRRPSSDEQRALLIKLEQEFEALKGRRVRNATPETAISQISFDNSVHSGSYNGESDLKAALNRAEADLRAMKALLAEVNVNLDDMCRQRDDVLRERDDWRSQAETWKAQAERLILTLPAPRSAAERPTLTLPAPRPALPGTTLEPPRRRSWWPWRRRAG
jgi:hypothetical protein